MQQTSHELNRKDAKARLARIISDLVSPPMVFAVLGFVLAWASLPFWLGTFWGAVYGFFVSLVPLLVVIYMYKTGQVKDLHISDTRQRRIPYLVGVGGAAVTYLLVSRLGGPPILGTLALSNVLGLGILGIVNNFWLISNHMASITSAVLLVWYVFGATVGLALSPLIVLVFYARLVLQRHTVGQLFAGAFVGFGIIWALAAAGLLTF